MEPGKIAKIILEHFDKAALKYGIMYIEALYNEGDSVKTVFKKTYEKDFPYLSYEVLEKNSQFMDKVSGVTNFTLELTSKYEKKIIKTTKKEVSHFETGGSQRVKLGYNVGCFKKKSHFKFF